SRSLGRGSEWGHDSTQRPPSNPCLTQASNAHLPFNDEGTGKMDTLLTFTTDERTARIALTMITDPLMRQRGISLRFTAQSAPSRCLPTTHRFPVWIT